MANIRLNILPVGDKTFSFKVYRKLKQQNDTKEDEIYLYNFIFYKNILIFYKKIEIFRKYSYNSDINALQNERDLESILCLRQEV